MTTKDFLQSINDCSELYEKLAACAAPEDVYALAKAEGVTDSREEFFAEVTRVKENARLMDADLEKVSAAGEPDAAAAEPLWTRLLV